MTNLDVDFLKEALAKDLILGPCLELDAALEGVNLKQALTDRSIKYYATDMVEGAGVDFVIDFEKPQAEVAAQCASVGEFGTILVMNVLEHTFDPIQVLDNVMSLIADGGTCLITTPTVFCLHDYPIDCWRIMPTFYTEYARRKGFEVVEGSLQFLGFGSVEKYRDGKQIRFPRPYNGNKKDTYSQFIHKLFRTWGRWINNPDGICTGVVLRKTKPVTQ